MDTNEILNTALTSDKSVGFFNDIFGVGWQDILTGTSPTGGAGSAIFEILGAFSAVILALITAFFVFVIAQGVAGTAHEGEALGKRYSTLYTPLRFALAISMLMPLPGLKLSLLGALMLKCVFLSVSGADYLTVKVTDFMVAHGGAIGTPRARLPYVEGIGEEILKNLVVQEYFKEREGLATDGVYAKETTGIKSFTFVPPIGADYGAMGKFKISCIDGVQSASLCDDELAASVTLVDEMRPVARAIVSQWSGGIDTPLDESQELDYRQALNNYILASQTAENAALAALSTNEDLQKFRQSVENNGWAWLGGYYWQIAKQNEAAQAKTAVKLMVSSSMNETAIVSVAGPEIQASLSRYHAFVDKIAAGRIQQRTAGGASGEGTGISSILASIFNDGILSSFGDNTAMTGGAQVVADTIATGDPINNLQKLGHSLINSGSLIGTLGAGTAIAGKAISAVSQVLPLGNSPQSKAVGAIGEALDKMGSAVVTLAGVLILAGCFLAYYLPALPFILWTSAIVGWLILTMEMMLAAPVWAAMHAIPEGEGMAGQHGRQGYMLFLGILFRPALYVAAFFLSFIIVSVVGHFIGESYLDFTTANAADDLPISPVSQIVGWLATVFIGCGLAIYSIHKVFSFMISAPDNIMKWAGANTPMLGSGDGDQRTNQIFAGGMGRAGGGALAIGGIAGGVAVAVDAKKGGNEQHTQGDKQ